MGFGKLSLTALLVATIFSLASTILTTEAFAKDAKSEPKCPMTEFLVMATSDCKSQPTKKEKTAEFLPSHTILQVEIPKKEKEEVRVPEHISFVSQIAPTEPQATLSAELLFQMVNEYRGSVNLPPFENEAQVCSVAESRRQEIANEIYQGLPMHSGFYAKNLPYWATENMIYMHTEAEALNWWLNSPIHRSAIEGNYKYACGVCNGEVCNMVFTNYEPKVVAVVPASITPTVEPTAQPTVTTVVTPTAEIKIPASARVTVPLKFQ